MTGTPDGCRHPQAPPGRRWVSSDEGGAGCFSPGALLSPRPPHGRAVRYGRVVVVERGVEGDSAEHGGR